MKFSLVVALVAALALLAACSDSGSPEPSATGPTPTLAPRVRPTPLAPAGRVTVYAADAGDSGGAVATGDFNGDGARDLLFTAAFADGPDNQRPDAGEAYVFFGPFEEGETRDAGAGEQDATIYGPGEGDQAGRGATAGDLNGDGIDDIVLGAPYGDGPDGNRLDAGEVHVVFGSPGLAGEVDLSEGSDLTVYGRTPETLAGFAVTTANLNGDDADDLIVGAFWANGPDDARTKAGEVYAVFGADQGARSVDLALGQQDVIVYGGAVEDRLGEGVAAGDVNGDGLDDLVIPAPFAVATSGVELGGQTYVIYSPSPPSVDLASDQPDATIFGADQGDQLGHTVSVGDTNGDGAADILLTAVSSAGEGNAFRLAGEAALVLGGDLPAIVDVAKGEARAIMYGSDPLDRLGRSSGMADTDGDGRRELLLGAPGAAGLDEALPTAGEIYLIKPSDLDGTVRLPSKARVYPGDDAQDTLGSEIYARMPLAAADMDGDGDDEIIVAAPLGDGPDNARTDCGEAYILFVSAD